VRAYRTTGSSLSIVEKQALWVAIGLPLMWLASRLPVRAFRIAAYPALLGTLALLVLVAVAGVSVNGNRNWLVVAGPIRLQPSEFAKLALVWWAADLLARKQKLLVQWKHLLVPLIPVGVLVTGLVLLGGDLGTAVILIAILAALLFVAGAPMRLFVAFGGLSAALVLWLSHSHSYRMRRITSWLDPSVDPQGVGWQALHGKYALASGGWWGLGLGGSKEKWGGLPEAHTDFIFAIVGEELGLVGTVAVVVLFAALGYAGFRVAASAKDPFVRLAAGGVTAWLIVQTLVNLGAVLGVLPITGVPLPLVSYGGSALLPTLIGLGMLMAFARAQARGTDRRAARPRRPAARG
jgi:cell division protein FtsW